MQKWEYAMITFRDGSYYLVLCGVTGNMESPVKVDKSKGDKLPRDAKRRTLAQLGREGWEMVGSDSSSPYDETLYFKRPIS